MSNLRSVVAIATSAVLFTIEGSAFAIPVYPPMAELACKDKKVGDACDEAYRYETGPQPANGAPLPPGSGSYVRVTNGKCVAAGGALLSCYPTAESKPVDAKPAAKAPESSASTVVTATVPGASAATAPTAPASSKAPDAPKSGCNTTGGAEAPTGALVLAAASALITLRRRRHHGIDSHTFRRS